MEFMRTVFGAGRLPWLHYAYGQRHPHYDINITSIAQSVYLVGSATLLYCLLRALGSILLPLLFPSDIAGRGGRQEINEQC